MTEITLQFIIIYFASLWSLELRPNIQNNSHNNHHLIYQFSLCRNFKMCWSVHFQSTWHSIAIWSLSHQKASLPVFSSYYVFSPCVRDFLHICSDLILTAAM